EGELLLAYVEELRPQVMSLGEGLEAIEDRAGVEAGAEGDEVGLLGPGEGEIGVADLGLGGGRGAEAEVDLAAALGALAHLGEALAVDDEEVLVHAVTLGEGLDLGLELAAARGDPEGAAEEGEAALGVAEAVLAHLRHLLEGDDLLGSVGVG